jgi:hypothetical protein
MIACSYCERQSTVQMQYDYCYHCGCFLCKKCTKDYAKIDPKAFSLSILREDLLPEIKTLGEL